MVIDLTNDSNLDESLLGFSANTVVATVKKELSLFDTKRPLSEAKTELDNLMKSRGELNSKIIDAINANDKKLSDDTSKKLRLLNKMIYIVTNEVDYKTKQEFLKAKTISKAPVDSVPKEVIETATEKVQDMEDTAKEEKELTKLITDIKASTGDVAAKAKSKISAFIENPKEYFTSKNVLILGAGALAIYGLIKFLK